jgi:hypothetical protein
MRDSEIQLSYGEQAGEVVTGLQSVPLYRMPLVIQAKRKFSFEDAFIDFSVSETPAPAPGTELPGAETALHLTCVCMPQFLLGPYFSDPFSLSGVCDSAHVLVCVDLKDNISLYLLARGGWYLIGGTSCPW